MSGRGRYRRSGPVPVGFCLVLWALVLSGCGLIFAEPEPRPTSSPAGAPVPGLDEPPEDVVAAGSGTLRQEEISISLRHGELQVRVTPLAESVIVTTAPDTYERLSAMGRAHQEYFLDRTGAAAGFQLMLVSLYSEFDEVAFEPEDLNLVSRGLRYRPVEIRAVTPAWDSRRVRPREVLMAVYAFPPEVRLASDLEVEFREVRSRDWERIAPRVEAERSRIRARPNG